MSVKITDRRDGYDTMLQNLFGGKKARVLVGITEEDGAQGHGNNAYTLLQIAVWNEFGTKKAPARPFLRGWFDKEENRQRVEKWLVALMPSIVSGKRTQAQVLDIIGLKIVGEIQKTMTGAGIPPANAEATIRKKGSATATVDTGVLRSKITHVVKDAGKDNE